MVGPYDLRGYDPRMDLEALTAADFEPHLHQRFRLVLDDAAPSELELVDVSEIPREPGGRAPFPGRADDRVGADPP